jgi:hypothetical protein
MASRQRSRLLPLVTSGLVVLAGTAALAGPSAPTMDATPTPYPASRTAAVYPTFDATGRAIGTAKWHWTSAGGNCCEVYITSTSKGQLLEFGGSQPFLSNDAGKTWQQVVFPTPLYNGEGAMVAGPNGDIFGIGWDPYTGDHLQGVRYSGATKKWQIAEAPLKTPVFDREWITYVKGPFQADGKQVPYITLVRGGTVTKSVEFMATDGISYTTVTSPNVDVQQQSGEPAYFKIPVVKNPAADSWQPNPGTYTLPMNAGGVLLFNNGEDDLGADAARLNPTTLKWERVRLAFKPTGVVRQDSRGWLTMATRKGNEIELQTSSNGGVTWKSTTLVLPASVSKIESSGSFFDIKVNGALGQAVVSTRADNKSKQGQDVVWRVDIRKAQPKVMKVYAVGKGNAPTAIGIVAGAAADRFDFPSVTLLPDGRIAVSFQDATTPRHVAHDGVPGTGAVLNPNGGHSPALAILD